VRIVSIGGGPAGLYFAILMKKAFPEALIEVFERNRPEDTFGFGVVFSDETLGLFQTADPESFARIERRFRYWRDIHTWHKGEWTVSTGHGFCALGRAELLQILHERCRELGVELNFEREIGGTGEVGEADLILAADGANSTVRAELEDVFKPRLDWRHCRFTWLGLEKHLTAFTFLFVPTEWGLFQVHAYPYAENKATFIVECRDEVWRKAGLEGATEADTVAFCENLFADFLGGARLLSNRSIWRRFPTIRCETWRSGKVILMGDAAHTAHFSIGSGTKLAMEDAMALAAEFELHGIHDVPKVLEEYEEKRWIEVLKLQRAAQTSLEWFENSGRYVPQRPLPLTFNLMTRSKRITFDNLRERDPALVEKVMADFSRNASPPVDPAEKRVPIFHSLRLRGLELKNRIVVSPMCEYSALDGEVNDWHLVHYGSRAIGGPGLLITEMTDVLPEGRITLGCAGLYERRHVAAWRRIVEFVHGRTPTKIGIQLAHAGRKSSAHHPWSRSEDRPLLPEEGAWITCAPSALPYRPHWPAPKAMDRAEMDKVRDAFVRATRWADEIGFDLVEVHMAHGYLFSSFLCPLTNLREDEYGGELENRLRFPLEVFRAMRAAWPREKPMSVRISATDWFPDGSGMTPEDSVKVARALGEAGCDVIDVSTAGNVPESVPEFGRMYQVPFAEKIRYETGLPVMAVGAIQGADHANTVLAAGRADLIAMARPHLHDPYLTLHAAEKYEYWDQQWPGQYLAAMPRPAKESPRKSEL
jgi:anthraniloyl-CoA monooxygenase